jgi:hypothetical protein
MMFFISDLIDFLRSLAEQFFKGIQLKTPNILRVDRKTVVTINEELTTVLRSNLAVDKLNSQTIGRSVGSPIS